MQKWEYDIALSRVIDVGDILKHRNKYPELPLDPALSDSQWKEQTFRSGHQDVARVMWSDPNKCYTTMHRALNEYGTAGWELVSTTPPLAITSPAGEANRDHINFPSFYLLFKRPLP